VADWDTGFSMDAVMSTVGGPELDVELIGPHLRVGGRIQLGRFTRLSDRVNHSSGYMLIHDARLLKRNGDPTPLVVQELLVNQDEVTFIALPHITGEDTRPVGMGTDRPLIEKYPRRYVVFTPGHVISGLVHVYKETTVSSFADSTDPRFVPMTQVSARSLADRRVISHFDLLLVNRTQMTAVAEAGHTGGGSDAPVVETT
jgi:hypothetical protein